jgi:hypothetical protein
MIHNIALQMLGYYCRCNFVLISVWMTLNDSQLNVMLCGSRNPLRRLYVWCYAPRCHMKRCNFLSDNKRPSYLDLRRGLCDSAESVRCSGIKMKSATLLSWREELLYIKYNYCNSNALWSLNQHVSINQVIFRFFSWRNAFQFIFVQCLHDGSLSAWCVFGCSMVLKQHVSTKQVFFRLFPRRIWISSIVCSIYVADFSLM